MYCVSRTGHSGCACDAKSGAVDDFHRYAQPNASYSVFELINGRCTALKWDRDAFTSGLNSLTYPRFLLFMFAVLPQFVVPVAGPVWLQLLVLGSIQKRAGMVSLGSVAMASRTFGNGS